MKQERIGKFYVTEELAESEEMLSILKQLEFVPITVNILSSWNEYIGYSPLFRILGISNEIPEKIPTYKITLYKLQDGNGITLDIGVHKIEEIKNEGSESNPQ